jgi:hypothetical protein
MYKQVLDVAPIAAHMLRRKPALSLAAAHCYDAAQCVFPKDFL